MVLKPLTKNARSQAAKLLADYWSERGMHKYNQKWAEGYLTEGHKKEIKNDEFFIYEENDEIIGTVSLVTDVSNVAEIRDMVVKQSHRRKGYGKKMLQDLIEIAKQRNLRKVYSLIFPQYEKLYTNFGFVKEGTLKSHFAQGEDLSIMSKFL